MLFGLSLADLPQYADEGRVAMLTLNLGDVAWRYFQLTEEPGAARRALDLYERTATLMDDPVPVSLAKLSFAMAAIDVLRVLGEPEAELATRRSDLRGRAIAEVHDAIRLADQVAAQDPQGAWQQQQQRAVCCIRAR